MTTVVGRRAAPIQSEDACARVGRVLTSDERLMSTAGRVVK